MRRFLRQPIDDVLGALEPIVLARSPLRALATFLLALVVTWFVYVPIHELLHALGCVLAGGEVSRLEIASKYGGAIWARIFPFVVSGGDYAGRLSGFDWKNSDAIYLATDFMPYLLTVLIGVPLIKIAGRSRRPVIFAAGVVVGLTPFYQLPGDYYEMGSILTTRAVTMIAGPPGPSAEPAAGEGHSNVPADPAHETDGSPAVSDAEDQPDVRFAKLRSDDVFLLLTTVFAKPHEVGLVGAGQIAVGLLVVVTACLVAVGLALLTYWLGHLFSVSVWRLPTRGRPRST